MKYYYKLSQRKLAGIGDFFSHQHKDYIFYSDVEKSKWQDDTVITWTCPRFTHTSSLHSFRAVLSLDVIKSLKQITEKEAFIRAI